MSHLVINAALTFCAMTMGLMLATAIAATLGSPLFGACFLTATFSGCIAALLFWAADHLDADDHFETEAE